MDIVSFLHTTSESVKSFKEGLERAANVKKAGYFSTEEAMVGVSYTIDYPPAVLVPSATKDKDDADEMAGWKWGSQYASLKRFKGSYQNGTKNKKDTTLKLGGWSYQRAIDVTFPGRGLGTAHAFFSELTREGNTQALGFLGSIVPLCELLQTTGLNEEEAWERTGLYVKSLFDSIRTVRLNPMGEEKGGAMLWGSLQTMRLVEEYVECGWSSHPKIAMLIAMSLMQKEGVAMGKLTVEVSRQGGQFTALEKKVKRLEAK